jgi:hypothetical protein
MKHLKKYNESIDESISEYINECFVEFFDDDKYETESESDYKDRYCLMINLPKKKSGRRINLFDSTVLRTTPIAGIDDCIKWVSEMNEFYLDIKTGINRVKDRYPNIDVKIEEDSFQKEIERNIIETTQFIRIYFIYK